MNKIKKHCTILIIIIFILNMFVSTYLFIKKSKSVLQNNYENDTRVVSGLISNVIDNSFLRPLTVAETIAKDLTTRRILDINSKEEALKMEETAANYLKTLRDGLGYAIVFAVSENSHAYFTYNGISKYVDIENDERDSWYKELIESGQPYKLDVDTDEAANWSLSVFINNAVYDENHRFIGSCGVGVDMGEMQDILKHYEEMYDVKINLINKNGLIQIDTDTSKIENDYIFINNITEYSDGECYYEVLPHGDRTITYMDKLEWYLVVQNNDKLITSTINLILPSVVCSVISLLILAAVIKIGTDNSDANK